MRSYFGTHNHSHYSNIRLLDAINRPVDMVNKAIELGLSGIAITDHECVSAWMEFNQIAQKLHESNPNFKIALGNEIYLTDDRSMGQKYYHFLLIAKDALGAKALRELSSIAWSNSYVDRRMERVPTLKSELQKVIMNYQGHIIATTACIGGELSSNVLLMEQARAAGDTNKADQCYKNITNFLDFCLKLFGEDFYIECAPSTNADQCLVNHKLYQIAKAYGIQMEVGTDAHYLTAAERPVHKAYLNSKSGEREVDDFYEYTYLMDADEVINLLSYGFSKYEDTAPKAFDISNWILDGTEKIREKIEFYSLERKQIIPKVHLDLKRSNGLSWKIDYSTHPVIKSLLLSNNIQEKYWIEECLFSLEDKGFWNDTRYIDRLEIEADIIKTIGEKLDDCLFAYFNTFQHYINLFWECGSIVGPGRGSSTGFLSNYLLGITQLDPIRWNLPYWRFLNKERAELPDIDIDLAPSKRPAIFEKIREERGQFGLVQVATFGTEGTKSAVLTACRGYRSEEFPQGIDVDEAQYMSSLIPQERGFLWSIHDVVYGDPDKDRKPVVQFINEVNNYEGLLDIIVSIEGLINKRSSHASGVILYDDDPYETASFMKTPGGDLITAYDLHKAEAAGDTKYDFLVTEASDKIIQCYELLKKDKQIPDISLRDFYNKYLHPEVINVEDEKIWKHLAAGDILDVFQFSTGVGLQIAKKLKPHSMLEMTAASALMRLMSERGKESQQDRFARIKADPGAFDKEMRAHGLSIEQRVAFHKYCDEYYGTVPLQEQMMEILMDKDIANFTLGEANAARKVVAKKQMSKIPDLRNQLYSKISDRKYADYVWEVAIAPSLGYAFSKNHSLPYSFVGVQMIYLATHFNPIYWNTSCLIVNSGATDAENGGSTNYGKVAKALGDIMKAGIKVSLVDINKSGYGFEPDIENNQILFGLKSMLNVGDEVIENTITMRPYSSPKDYLEKVKPNKQAMISLIKGGAFDKMEDRKFTMAWYIWETCDKKKRLTLQNMSGLIKHNLLPEHTQEQKNARRVFEFNRYLKKVCLSSDKQKYLLDTRALNFLVEMNYENIIQSDGSVKVKDWECYYQNWMDVFRKWINENKDEILNNLNTSIFKEDWDKYAQGTISSWEMEVLCFYYHEHELKNVDMRKYGYEDFFGIPENPIIVESWKTKTGHVINKFQLYKICGTCIAKDKIRSTVTLLTTSGVVDVKFRKEYFSLFDKQISARGDDGVKHRIESSWFNRGSMIVVQGIRSGDTFIPKKYNNMGNSHQLYRIESLYNDGKDVLLQSTRAQGEVDEED